MILLWSWELALESRSESEMPSRVKSPTVPRYAAILSVHLSPIHTAE